MFDFITRYVMQGESASEVVTNETISETGSTPPIEEETDEESDVISHTLDWGFLDYVEHLLILSRSDEGEDLEVTRTKVIQNSWTKIDEKALFLHKALLIKAEKLYKQDLATLNLTKRQDSKRESEQLYHNTLLKILVLNNKKYTAKDVEKIDIKTILNMNSEEYKTHQERINKENSLTDIEKLIMAAEIK